MEGSRGRELRRGWGKKGGKMGNRVFGFAIMGIAILPVQVRQVKNQQQGGGGSRVRVGCNRGSNTRIGYVDATFQCHLLLPPQWRCIFTPAWNHPSCCFHPGSGCSVMEHSSNAKWAVNTSSHLHHISNLRFGSQAKGSMTSGWGKAELKKAFIDVGEGICECGDGTFPPFVCVKNALEGDRQVCFSVLIDTLLTLGRPAD